MPPRSARSRSREMISSVVSAPMSEASSANSKSSSDASSTSRVNATTEAMLSERDVRVRVTACFMRSKKPTRSAGGSGASVTGSAGASCACCASLSLSRRKKENAIALSLPFHYRAMLPAYDAVTSTRTVLLRSLSLAMSSTTRTSSPLTQCNAYEFSTDMFTFMRAASTFLLTLSCGNSISSLVASHRECDRR